jgi:hypothetical protein
MRPKATTRRSNWVQLGMVAGALLLPPLALGAALYSMLAPPAEDLAGSAAAKAAVPQPAAMISPAGKSADDVTRSPGRTPAASGSVPAVPAQGAPAQVVTTAAVTSPPGDAEASAAPPAAENPPAAPKRPVHRRPRPQEDAFPLKKWLQQMGILPPNAAKDGRG